MNLTFDLLDFLIPLGVSFVTFSCIFELVLFLGGNFVKDLLNKVSKSDFV
jgi:hypothetical protein